MAVATDMSNIAFYTSSNLGTTGSALPNNERMRIDSSGNVGIGTTTPSSFGGGLVVRKSNTAQGVTNATAQFSDAVNSALWVGHTSGATNLVADAALTFGYSNGTTTTENARITTGGDLLVGTTSNTVNNSNSFVYRPDIAAEILNHINGTSSGAQYIYFGYNGSTIGSITQNGTTAVAYNTTSDYRLKENVQPVVGALARVAALNPVTYTWKAAPDETGEGFIAHELAEVCPHAVTGAKDAVDAEGNPKYQGIDTSFLVATLTAAIQEQQALIQSLTTRITALETP
jgi:hypothetical protein